MTDLMNGITDLFVLAMEPEQGHPDSFPIPGILCGSACSGRIGPLESRKEHLFFLLQVPNHVGGDLFEDGGNPDNFGVVNPMNTRYFPGIRGNLLIILLEKHMVGIDDIIGKKRQRP